MSNNTPFNRAMGDIERYARWVDREPWKEDHESAMLCLNFEDILARGVELFDLLMRLDEGATTYLLTNQRPAEEFQQCRDDVKVLIEWWLRPCDNVERKLQSFENDFGTIRHSEEFRRRHAEARWMLQPPSEAFDDPKITEARDAAVDDLRAGNVR